LLLSQGSPLSPEEDIKFSTLAGEEAPLGLELEEEEFSRLSTPDLDAPEDGTGDPLDKEPGLVAHHLRNMNPENIIRGPLSSPEHKVTPRGCNVPDPNPNLTASCM